MSAFPPPLNQPPVFNPSLFTSAVTNVIAAVDPNPQAYLEYPTAQGPVNFVSGSNQTTVGAQNLAILTNVGTTDNGIIFGANGLVYNGVTGPLGITWSNLATKIEAIQALTQASDATTLNVNNTIRIQDGETESDPISYINISSGITNEIVSTTDLLFGAPNIDISGQASFQLPPHIPEPILGNDAASKGYVDSLVGQYSGGYNLFFNYSETDATYPTNKVLAKLVSSAAQQTNVITGFTSGTQIVATFITEPFNISEIPAGLWDALIYGAVSGTGGDVHYSYEVFKVDDLGNETSIAQSGISADVNASPSNNPTAYSINATFPTAVVMVPTDRIRIVLSVTKTGTNTISLTTFFENQYYSFVQTSLNAGTNITGSNNIFTGTNEFSLPATTPTQVGTPANTDIVNYETITTLIGDIPTPDLADVLDVGTDANAKTITNLNILQTNSYNYIGLTSADYIEISPTTIEIKNGTTAYPNTHLDKTYLSIDASSNQYAKLENIDTPRLSLNTPTRTTELTAQSFYAGVGFGNASQVLTRTSNDFEYEWKDIPTPTLDEVLEAGNSGTDKTINLTSTGEEIQLSANNITLIDTSVGGVFTTLNKSSLTSYNAVTGKNFTLNADNLLFNDGTAFIQLAPTLLSFNGNQGTNNQVLTKDAITNAPVWLYPEPIVSTLQYFISQTSPFFQYPPQQPTSALLASYQYYGWYFINSVALRKIDWFFAPDYAMTVADVKGLYMNYFNITTTSNDNLPFISIYTKPTGVNDVIPFFCHSVATYIANFNPTAATAYCSFMNISGTQPDPFPYGHQLGSMILSPVQPNPRGEYLPTEEILAICVGSNSTSPVNQVNFIMGKVGICLEQGNQENILNPQDILSVPTISQVLTSGSVASNQNMSGIATLTATKLVTPTIDNSGNTLTIGANNTALTLGKTSTITNIQGNFQIAGSAGSNAQVLTSNGTTAEWSSLPASSWVGTATSQLNMGIYDISGAVLDNSGGTLAVGGNTTTTTIGKATTGITNLQGIVKINNSAGTSGQVLTSTGASSAPTWQTATSGWTGTATSQLNMGIYDISGAVLDNSGGLVTIGANTTGLTLGKTAVTTNIKGNLQINSAAGTSGQVLTSAGSGSAPTWQTPTAGSTSLAVVKTNPVLSTSAFAGGSNRGVYNNNFLNITPPTLTATYLIKCQLTCNNQGVSASLFGNLGIQAGGGAQTTAAINAFNGTAMSVNTTFSQTNSLSQCSVNATSVFSQLSFTYIHTPATLSTLSYALWTGTTGNGAATIFSMEIIQIIA